MSVSKIDICNIALARLGEAAIRSFDEKNKRARMCDTFFDFSRDQLLVKFDWPFAKKYVEVHPIDAEATGVSVPTGFYVYDLPHDCLIVRDVEPAGSKESWYTMEKKLYCRTPPDSDYEVYVYYTAVVVDTALYSWAFANLLSLLLAVNMCPAITQDKDLFKALSAQYENEKFESWETDANAGNVYKEPDNRPDNDSFVNPDGWVSSDTLE